MSSYPTSTSASGIWQLGDIPLYIQDGAWPSFPIGLVSGGYNSPSYINVINRVDLVSAGNATDFGDLITASGVMNSGQVGNTTRAIIVAGPEYQSPASAYNNTIEFTTYATTGNGQDFGDLTVARTTLGGVSSSTRGAFGGGATAPAGAATNVIDFITIASAGNAIDFGDTTAARTDRSGLSSPTRGVWGGGFTGPSTMFNEIEFITIASTGNATDFGDLLAAARNMGGGGNSTRGIFGGGQLGSPFARQNVIQFITIASAGNTIDFGDLTIARASLQAMSSRTNVVFAGGGAPTQNTIDFIITESLGNATDFGDLTSPTQGGMGASSLHGGLQ